MKNIRIYNAKKYSRKDYVRVDENIYQKLAGNKASNNCLSLQQVVDAETLKTLNGLNNWEEGKTDMEEDYLIVVYNGRKYYKDMDDEEEIIFENMSDDDEVSYVTSLMFEQEPELGENKPSDLEVSQYPLEDILDKFFCSCGDFYEKENKKDAVNSYMEFVSSNIEDIKKLLSIVGKHVYNKENGNYVELVIE